MRLILKTLAGLVVGLAYGALIGGSLFLISLLAGDPPVDLMLDYTKIFRFLIVVATIISTSAGVLVGLTVTLSGVDKIKARIIGFSFGLVILAGIVFTTWPGLKNELSGTDSWIELSFLFLMFLVLFVVFPIGLAVTGVKAVVISGKFASRRLPRG